METITKTSLLEVIFTVKNKIQDVVENNPAFYLILLLFAIGVLIIISIYIVAIPETRNQENESNRKQKKDMLHRNTYALKHIKAKSTVQVEVLPPIEEETASLMTI